MTRRATSWRAGRHGFTLIELMIGLTLGLMVVGAMITFYLSSKKSFRVQEATSRVQETGRFVIETIDSDLRMAGHRGCNGAFVGMENTLNTSTALSYDFGVPVQGYNGGALAWTPSLDSGVASLTPAPIVNTDVLAIRRTVGAAINVRTPYMSSFSSDIYVDASSGLTQYDIVIANDCNGSAAFQITNANVATGLIQHATGAGTPGNSNASLGRRFKGEAEIRRAQTFVYYIAASLRTPGLRSLWRVRGTTNAPEELVEGVEDLQVSYGVDTNNDLTADAYINADTVADFSQVVSVRVAVLVVTLEDALAPASQPYDFNGITYSAPGDKRLRRSFSTIVSIRNRTL